MVHLDQLKYKSKYYIAYFCNFPVGLFPKYENTNKKKDDYDSENTFKPELLYTIRKKNHDEYACTN